MPRNVVTLSPRLLPLMTNARRDRTEARLGELYRYRRVEDRIEIARRRRGPAQPRARRPTAVWFSGTSRTATSTPERRSSPNWTRSIQNGVGRSRSVPCLKLLLLPRSGIWRCHALDGVATRWYRCSTLRGGRRGRLVRHRAGRGNVSGERLARRAALIMSLVWLHRRLPLRLQWVLALGIALVGPAGYLVWGGSQWWNWGQLTPVPLVMLVMRDAFKDDDDDDEEAPPRYGGLMDGPWGPP